MRRWRVSSSRRPPCLPAVSEQGLAAWAGFWDPPPTATLSLSYHPLSARNFESDPTVRCASGTVDSDATLENTRPGTTSIAPALTFRHFYNASPKTPFGQPGCPPTVQTTLEERQEGVAQKCRHFRSTTGPRGAHRSDYQGVRRLLAGSLEKNLTDSFTEESLPRKTRRISSPSMWRAMQSSRSGSPNMSRRG